MDEQTKEILHSLRSMQKHFKGSAPKGHFFQKGVMNMTLSQLDTMAYLYDNKRATMSALAKNACVKMPTMTDMIDKLVKMGFLTREHDEKDRRTVWISITKNVEKMVCGHLAHRDEAVAKIMNVLTPREKKQAASILKKITKSLERIN